MAGRLEVGAQYWGIHILQTQLPICGTQAESLHQLMPPFPTPWLHMAFLIGHSF